MSVFYCAEIYEICAVAAVAVEADGSRCESFLIMVRGMLTAHTCAQSFWKAA